MAFSGCIDVPDDDGPTWSPEILGPATKSVSSIEDVTDLEDKSFNITVNSQQIDSDFVGQVDSVPAFSSPSVGPEQFELTEFVESANVDSLNLRITFENTYPINVAAGTELVFRSSDDRSLIFRHELQKDIKPNERFSRTFKVVNKKVYSNIDFFMEDFRTDGSNGEPVNFNSNNSTRFQFDLNFLRVNNAIIKNDKEFSARDTSDFNLVDEIDDDEASDTTVKGKLFIYVENGFPIRSQVGMIFLDEFGNTIYTLIPLNQPEVISPAQLQTNGDVTSIAEKKIEVEVSKEVIEDLKKAETVITTLDFDTNHLTENQKVTRESTFLIQIVADVTVRI